MDNIIELFPTPAADKKCSFCGNESKKLVEIVDRNVCICYSCVDLANKKLKES